MWRFDFPTPAVDPSLLRPASTVVLKNLGDLIIRHPYYADGSIAISGFSDASLKGLFCTLQKGDMFLFEYPSLPDFYVSDITVDPYGSVIVTITPIKIKCAPISTTISYDSFNSDEYSVDSSLSRVVARDYEV